MASLGRIVYDQLRDEIITGKRQQGEQLSAHGLAQKYKTSKTPVREALKTLQYEGLVEIIPRVGYFVSRVTVADINDVFELRRIVETAAAELAAQNISEEELLYLESFRGGYAPDDIEECRRFLAHNREFHYKVALATGNRRLAYSVGVLLDEMQRFLFLRLELSQGIESEVEDHQQLVAALRARDSAAAREAMVRDIENARLALLRAVMGGANVVFGLNRSRDVGRSSLERTE